MRIPSWLRFCAGALFIPSAANPCSARAAEIPLHIELGNNLALDLVAIAPGSFQQGSPSDEKGRRPDETAREVKLSRKFYLGKFPVTRGQFGQFVLETGYRTEAEAGPSGGFGWDGQALSQRKEFTWRNPGFKQENDDPVTLVTYGDAKAFLARLGDKAIAEFQLPSEAQWEYACRAGSSGAWPAGLDAADPKRISWNKSSAGNTTHAVGQMPLNAWGLGDMLGNVWEWCDDWYGPYAPGAQVDPLCAMPPAGEKSRRVLRGGSWLREPLECRPASRYRNDPGSRNADNGFRVMTFGTPKGAAPAQSLQLEASPAAGAASAWHAKDRAAAPIACAGFGFGFVIIFGLAVLVFPAVVKMFRSGGAGNSDRIFGNPLSDTTLAEDGFWISSNAFTSGDTLLCQYETTAGRQEIQVVFEPAGRGQFVYTGSRPLSVSVRRVSGPAVLVNEVYDDPMIISTIAPNINIDPGPPPPPPPPPSPPPPSQNDDSPAPPPAY